MSKFDDKTLLGGEEEMKFIDEVCVTLSSGKGGGGCVSFRREAHIPRGGPDGGDGGRGGDIILRARTGVNSLISFKNKKILFAEDGQKGQSYQRTGRDGKDLILEVPIGTIVRNDQQQIVLDMNEAKDEVFLKGGRGGKGNFFFRTSVNQAPTYAQPGEPHRIEEVTLELSLLADVGIVGFPNAGKSTLISRLSSAKPKIADYPFTTLIPSLGVVKLNNEQSFVLADIPGLIKGAHKGVGLGLQFLKHIERTRLLLHLIDITALSGRNPIDDYFVLNEELKAYDETQAERVPLSQLSSKEQIVLLNKIDALSLEELEKVKDEFKKNKIKFMTISSVSGAHLQGLLYEIKDRLFDQQN